MNRRRLLLAVTCLPALLAPLAAVAAEGPQGTVDRFLAATAAGDLAPVRELLADEAVGWSGVPVLEKGPDFKIAHSGPDAAVARVRFKRPDDASPDGYLFLRREGGVWKIQAFRALAALELLVTLRRQLRAGVELPEADRQALPNLDLILGTDAELRAWFSAHRERCDDFVSMARQAKPGDGTPLEQYAKDLGFDSFVPGDPFQLVLGGMIDNSVGFLFTRGPAPQMSSEDYIWVEPLGGGWHLFKTT